jgi:hypothetical protein
MVYNRRGWLRILEATIAVLIVISTLVVVYSNQPTRTIDLEEYMYNLQKKILLDIGSRSDLRANVLNYGDFENSTALENFTSMNVPSSFRHSIKVCDLSNGNVCKLNNTEVIETKNKNVFVEETIVSADFGDYNPKKVRVFIWEGN